MALANNPSAGTYALENDNSIRATAGPTSIGAVVGASTRGPVGERKLVVDGEEFRRYFGQANPALGYMHYTANAFLLESNRLYVTRVTNGALTGGGKITTVTNFSTATTLAQGYADPSTLVFDPQDILYFYAENPGAWNNNLSVVVYPDVDDIDEENFVVDVYENGVGPVESFVCSLHLKTDGYGVQLQVEDRINRGSDLIRVRLNTSHPALQIDPEAKLINAVAQCNLSGGDDGDLPTPAQIIQAWQLYEDPEEVIVNILMEGGSNSVAVQLEMDRIAQKRDDAMAVLDVPSNEQEAQDAVNFRRNTLALSSSYSALYGPDVLIRDTENGRNVYVPVSGFVGAIYARTDRVAEAWFAPAGLNRGLLDVIGVRHIYKQGHRDMFDENNINPIRFMAGQGIAIWGADTLQSFKSDLSNVNVRRLLSLLKTTLRIATLPGVFEPNDDFLRAELRGIAEGILRPIKQGRGVYAFEVVCDGRNNTNELQANGDVVLDVYIAPTVYSKRIHLNAIATKTGGIRFAQQLLDNQ